LEYVNKLFKYLANTYQGVPMWIVHEQIPSPTVAPGCYGLSAVVNGTEMLIFGGGGSVKQRI
jgi:hypothetical protein